MSLRTKVIVLTLLFWSLSLSALAQPGQDVQDLIIQAEDLVKSDGPSLGELKLKSARLEKELPDLKSRADASDATADKDWLSRADAALTLLKEKIKKAEEPSIAALIGSTKPMTAVLFSAQHRNTFEVVKDPASGDATIGIINQEQSGSTGGILIAAEAPFAFPKIGRKRGVDEEESRMPIGAWFGVNLKTGSGEDFADVDLAAGLSFSLISANRIKKLREQGNEGLSGSARLLIGVVYGEVATLGPKDTTTALKVGDPYPLNDTLPLKRDKKISWAIGIGFRF